MFRALKPPSICVRLCSQSILQQNYATSVHGGRVRRVKRVALGISGGVDSTVSALLLKRKGYEVIGVFMKNWDTLDESGFCRADNEAEEAEAICKQLDIPFRLVNFVKEYWQDVFTNLVSEYENGFTPNPDIQCNRHLKFGHFYRYCLENVGCDAVATGHYARTSFGEDLEHKPFDGNFESEFYGKKRVKLLKAIDRIKDQTFFLAQVDQEPLRSTMFPIGGFTKDVVKKIAATSGFEHIAAKRESMGICFIGKRKNGFGEFIQEYIPSNPGNFVDMVTGKVMGSHSGIHIYTLGQRAPLGSGLKQRYYIADKDPATQTVFVCPGRDHPALYSETFFTGQPHWIDSPPPELTDRQRLRTLECEYRSQNTHPLSSCVVMHSMTASPTEAGGASNYEFMDRSCLTVCLAEPERALTPGQYAVFYLGDECLGSARIDRVGPSLYTMNKDKCRDQMKNQPDMDEDVIVNRGDKEPCDK